MSAAAEDLDVDVTEYRVTVESLTEQYEYYLDATDEASAVQQGYENALDDGLPPDAWRSIKAEVL